MPITPYQQQVLHVLAANRSPNSFVAGGTVLNTSSQSPRFTDDLDIFHDTSESVATCAVFDGVVLHEAGYAVTWLLQQPTFYRGLVERGAESVKMEWVADSAFRFFPVEPDDLLGWRLHFADAATNKILALAGRRAIRDYIDVLHLHQTYLSLGALIWAAAAKDTGLTPDLILEQASRNTRYQEADLQGVALQRSMSLRDLKAVWLAAEAEASAWIGRLPPNDYGALYLDATGRPCVPDPDSREFSKIHRHYGSVGGAWPRII